MREPNSAAPAATVTIVHRKKPSTLRRTRHNPWIESSPAKLALMVSAISVHKKKPPLD
jgi:hypothetical protein